MVGGAESYPSAPATSATYCAETTHLCHLRRLIGFIGSYKLVERGSNPLLATGLAKQSMYSVEPRQYHNQEPSEPDVWLAVELALVSPPLA
jgi:hypothetical protein